jgi:hypothetical protein
MRIVSVGTLKIYREQPQALNSIRGLGKTLP